MRINTFFYSLGQGLKNVFKHFGYSLASIATMAACVFLFCTLYSVLANVTYMVENIETKVGITVFFDEGMTEEEILNFGALLSKDPAVSSVTYTSAEQAWENFKKEYFADNPELAEGFADDNPLADSASYEIFLKSTDRMAEFVDYLQNLQGVRRVNYSGVTAQGLTGFRRILTMGAGIFEAILLAVSIFLIGNTVAASIHTRRDEIRIMRLIGAENSMIRASFVIEGLVIGVLGAAIPLLAFYFGYESLTTMLHDRYPLFAGIMVFLPRTEIMRVLLPAGLGLGIGIGILGSRISVHRHLRV